MWAVMVVWVVAATTVVTTLAGALAIGSVLLPAPAGAMAPGQINLGTASNAVDVAEAAGTPLGLLDRDAGLSVQLSDGNQLWLFADTTFMLNGQVAWYSHRGTGAMGNGGDPFHLHEPAVINGWIVSPASSLILGGGISCPAGYGDFYWPSSAVAIPQGGGRDRVLIYYQAMCGRGSDLNTFYSVVTGIAEYDYDTAAQPTPDRPIQAHVLNTWLFAPLPGHTAAGASYGAASMYVNGMIYAYGCRYSPYFQYCRVGRASPADVAEGTNYSFWNGSAWVKDINQAVDMDMPSPLVGVKGSVAWIPSLGRYVFVDNDFPNPQVAVRFATNPQGPWTAPTMVALPDCVGRSCRAGEIQGSLSDARNLTITYYAEGLSSSPRAVRVPVVTEPIGAVDGASSSAPGQVTLGGWALDPDVTQSIAVHVYVDGHFAVAVPASGSRPDVAAAHPGYGASHGFNATVTGLTAGAHTFCAYAINVGNGVNNPPIGCPTVTVRAAFAPVVATNADGRLEVFASDALGGLAHAWQNTPGGLWSPWAPMYSSTATTPVVATNSDGRLEIFRVEPNGALMHSWQSPVSISGWSQWEFLGIYVVGTPVVANDLDGRLDLYARGQNQDLIHNVQVPGRGWGSWQQTGASVIAQPAMSRSADGRLEIFVPSADHGLIHSWQITANGGWSSFWSLGTSTASTPIVTRNTDGRLEIFSTRTDSVIEHSWQVPSSSSGWSGWASLGATSTGPLAASPNPAGLLELFTPTGAGTLVHASQAATSASGWSAWYPMGLTVSRGPTVGRNPDASLELFAVDGSGALVHAIETMAGWSAWSPVTAGLP